MILAQFKSTRLKAIGIFLLFVFQISSAESMHPQVQYRDNTGKLLILDSSLVNFSPEKTCGECHDYEFIRSHSNHSKVNSLKNQNGELNCLVCHASENTPNLSTKIHSPKPEQCANCHQSIHTSKTPLGQESIDQAKDEPIKNKPIKNETQNDSLIKMIWSPQLISQSKILIAGKDTLHEPWDIHASRGLTCNNCHTTANNPAMYQEQNGPKHLKFDPRGPTTGQHLKFPDHRLTGSREDLTCIRCHETKQHNDWLPYAKVHMNSLSCQACHSLKLPLGEQGKNIEFRHNIVGSSLAIRDCNTCHTPNSILTDNDYVKGKNNLYVFGRDSVPLVDWIGLFSLLAVLTGILIHGGLRIWVGLFRKSKKHTGPTKRVYMYGTYERIWHWLQAGAIISLLLTGLEIHLPKTFAVLGFENAVMLHNAMGIVLGINALLSLFYHMASGEIKQFLPEPKGFFSEAIAQQSYYLKGIFTGAEHPFEKSKSKKLNPLQKIAYLGLLNILLPTQIITGLLMLIAGEHLEWIKAIGGLEVLTTIHSFCSWQLGVFLVMHIYLTTTGETIFDLTKAMITGYEQVPGEKDEPKN